MARVVLLLFALFMLLTVLRGLRIFFRAALGRSSGPAGPARRDVPRQEEMIRDPVCGTWIDRRLALPATRDGATIAVCSDRCRRSLEAAG